MQALWGTFLYKRFPINILAGSTAKTARFSSTTLRQALPKTCTKFAIGKFPKLDFVGSAYGDSEGSAPSSRFVRI
jgi:hypothetical protein